MISIYKDILYYKPHAYIFYTVIHTIILIILTSMLHILVKDPYVSCPTFFSVILSIYICVYNNNNK